MPTTTTTTVTTTTTPRAALAAWTTVLGDTPSLGEPFAGRDLWPVTAEDGRQYFLKRLGPWRNLPLADEARVLRHLAQEGIGVAEYLPTDRASLFAGAVEESFVLMPRLADERLTAPDLLPCEETIGRALA
ncbi:MAG TPA: hypothetical protein VNP95_06625, partial [Thermomicrobiales bacterium]|nr:hypothetical protein [Thermomicrobiales bacterium]